MKKSWKEYWYECLIFVLMVIFICTVYLVKGKVAAFIWTTAIFVVGPIGVLLLVAQLLILIVRCILRNQKKVRISPFVASIVLAFPVLIMTGVVFIPYPDNANRSESVQLSNPVEGEIALFGGENYRIHAVWPSERYAYDILEAPYDTGSSDLHSYGIYGKNVFAPIKGEIIETHDGEEDIRPNSEDFTSLLGNYIFMRIEETGTYLIFAHLKNNSITIAKGDLVEVGTVLAQVGNSGTTSEPHLHIQHQKNNPCNTAFLVSSEGLPITFKKAE